jgi:hypothetical protein
MTSKVHDGMFGDSLEIESGGVITVKSGGRINLESGGKIQTGGADLAYVIAVAGGYKIARGQLSTASASDTVVTGLTTVVSVVATLESDPVDTCSVATAQVGDQAGAPAAGSVIIKTWKPTTGGAAGNPTLIAATAFTKKVNWIAIGV